MKFIVFSAKLFHEEKMTGTCLEEKRMRKQNRSAHLQTNTVLCYTFVRYSEGVLPANFLKALLNADFELYPTLSAISSIVKFFVEGSLRRRLASSIL